MIKRICDCCKKEIKSSRNECKITVLIKNECSSNLDLISKEIGEMDLCETCIGNIYSYILQGGDLT